MFSQWEGRKKPTHPVAFFFSRVSKKTCCKCLWARSESRGASFYTHPTMMMNFSQLNNTHKCYTDTHIHRQALTHTQKSTYTDTQTKHTQINDFSTHNVSWKKTYSTKNRSPQKIFPILFFL